MRNAPASPAVGFISDLCVSSSLFPSYCVSRGVVVRHLFSPSLLSPDPSFIFRVPARVFRFFHATQTVSIGSVSCLPSADEFPVNVRTWIKVFECLRVREWTFSRCDVCLRIKLKYWEQLRRECETRVLICMFLNV